MRQAYRRLYSAAAAKSSYFSMQQQNAIRVWQRVSPGSKRLIN